MEDTGSFREIRGYLGKIQGDLEQENQGKHTTKYLGWEIQGEFWVIYGFGMGNRGEI
jgi:hypothetical protein